MNIMENPSVKLGRLTSAAAQESYTRKFVKLTDIVGLAYGRVHEVTGPSQDSFAVCIAAKTAGPIVWIGRDRDVYSLCPSALSRFFDPARLITIECTSRQENLWAAEEALRSKGAECVIVQMDQGPNLKESRRLQLAAEAGRCLGLILIGRRAQSSAAQTRWHCRPAETKEAANDQIWRWELTKNKSGKTGIWDAVLKGQQPREEVQGGRYGTHHVHLDAASSA